MVTPSRRSLLATNFLASAVLFTTVSAQGLPSFIGQVIPATIAAECQTLNAPDSVTVGQRFVVGVTLRNTGPVTWTSQNTRIYEVSGPETSNTQIFKLPAVQMQPDTVSTGQSGSPKVEYRATAPNTPGEYPLRISVQDNRHNSVRAGACVKKIKVLGNGQSSLPARGAPSMVCLGFEGLPATRLAPGQQMNNILVKMRNTGIYTWDSNDPDQNKRNYAFESWQQDPADPSRWIQNFQSPSVYFENGGVVAPGGIGHARVNSIAPTTPGTYRYEWQVAEGGSLASQNRCSVVLTVPAQCADGVDNDGDGKRDTADTGCWSELDNDETTATVNIRVNGQEGPVTVVAGTTVTVDWTSTDAQRCNTGTSLAPWGPNIERPTSGTAQVVVNSNMTLGIQCSEILGSNMIAQDSVAVNVAAQCSDGIDNDQDGVLDLQDSDCLNAQDTREDSGLLARYTFEDGTSRDVSGKGSDGTPAGGVAIQDGCAVFDGNDDFITVPNFDRDSFTVSTWAKKENGGRGHNAIIGGQRTGGWALIYGGEATAQTGPAQVSLTKVGVANVRTSERVNPSEFYHLAATYSRNGNAQNGTVKIYINGQLKQINSNSLPLFSNGNLQYVIGGLPTAPTVNAFKGTLDDVRVYDYALSDAEIARVASETQNCGRVLTQCNDAIDNDGDTKIDGQDGGCANAEDNNEADGNTDISLSLVTSVSTALQNEPYLVTVTATNAGPDNVTTPIVVEMNLPTGTQYLPENSAAGCTQLVSGVVSCQIDRLAVGAQYPMGLRYRIHENSPCLSSITHEARVASSPQGDPNTNNNQSLQQIGMQCAASSSSAATTSSSSSSFPRSIDNNFSTSSSSSSSSSSAARIVVDEQRCGVPSCTLAPIPAGADAMCRMNCSIPVWDGVACSTVTTTMACATTVPTSLSISVDGPVQQTYTPITNDAVLANVNFTPSGAQIKVNNLYVAIQGQTATGGGLLNNANGRFDDDILEVLEDVQMRNRVTGQVVNAVRLTGAQDFGTGYTSSSTYQIYRFDDLSIVSGETWEIRADFIRNANGHPRNSDRFRAIVCGEPAVVGESLNTNGCNFLGLGTILSTNTSYNILAVDAATDNDVTDVRPGGNLAGNFHLVSSPSLRVALRGSVASDVAVKNQKGVSLLHFEARAEVGDVRLTQAVFRSTRGSLLNGTNYTLLVDTDLDSRPETAVQSNVNVQGDRIIFNNLAGGGMTIPKDTSIVFEVRTDIQTSLVDDHLQLAFASSDPGFLQAEEESSGADLNEITYNAGNAVTTDYTLMEQGSLFITKSNEQLRSRQLLAGEPAETALLLNMRTLDEDVDVTDLDILVEDSSATSIQQIGLYKEGSTSPFVIATQGSCDSSNTDSRKFCANMENRQLVLQKNSENMILFRPLLKQDQGGAVRGELLTLTVNAVRAKGGTSSRDLLENNGDNQATGEIFIGTNTPAPNTAVEGPTSQVVFAKLASLTNAGPTDGTITTGVSPLGQFNFVAAQNNNTLNGLNRWVLADQIFSVTAVNMSLNTGAFKLYNANNTSVKMSCTVLDLAGGTVTGTVGGSFFVSCADINTKIISELDSASSMRLVLEGEVVNPAVSSTLESVLQVSIRNFSNPEQSSVSYMTSHVRWLDADTSSVQFYWIDNTDTQVNSTRFVR